MVCSGSPSRPWRRASSPESIAPTLRSTLRMGCSTTTRGWGSRAGGASPSRLVFLGVVVQGGRGQLDQLVVKGGVQAVVLRLDPPDLELPHSVAGLGHRQERR